MLVGEVMNREVKTVRPDSNIVKAAEEMNRYRIGSLVVLDGSGKIIGIITERTILTEIVAMNRNPENTKVEEIMTKEVIAITPMTRLEDAAQVMSDKKIKKLPVVDKNKLVGIITASDLITYEKVLVEKVGKLLLMKGMKGFGG